MKKPSHSHLSVRNPHSILAAMEQRPSEVLDVTLPTESTDPVWKQIEIMAEALSIKIAKPVNSPRESLGRESAHGAHLLPKKPVAVETLFSDVDPNRPDVWLALDCLQDPQNLGAIFRSASFFGVRGILMTTERSAPMTQTVYDIASGGVETVPYAGVINLQRAFEVAKDCGVWILGTSEHAKESIRGVKADRPWLIVVGNEEKGMRRLTEESCDQVCVIPSKGSGSSRVTSLNVSVATGVILSRFSI